ncbi:MAG: TatD family hydrolase [Clostridia bacterium]
MNFIDTHVHLNDKKFTDIEQVIERAIENNVTHMINIGSDLESSRKAIEQSVSYDMLYSAVGFHPHGAKNVKNEDYDELIGWLDNKKVLAIGEIGLDYHYDFSPRDTQKEVFIKQMEIAKMYNYPVVIHNRESHKDVFDILSKFANQVKGILHCYSGSYEMAVELIDMGYYISVAGPVTFKNAKRLPEVVKKTSLDRLLIETDCPYLAPVPYRGKRNEPSYVVEVAKKIAEIKGISLSDVARETTKNAQTIFNFEIDQ